MNESENFRAFLSEKQLVILPGKHYRIGDRVLSSEDDSLINSDRYSLAHQLLMCCMDGLALGAESITCQYGLSRRGRMLDSDDYGAWQRAGDEAGFTWERTKQEMCPGFNYKGRRVIARLERIHGENPGMRTLEEVTIEVDDAVPAVGTDVHERGDDD